VIEDEKGAELTSTENKIGFARQGFNDAATDYNIRREVFPAIKVAGMFKTPWCSTAVIGAS
jgi:hypothetical protein